ncbi:unnamed protein product, partial [Lampetra fluviatilis]
VRLIDAGFIWTEPHSKRIRVKLTIQKEVMNGVVLQQVFVLELIVSHQMCDDCHRVEAKDFWKAVVQLRQKASHKKTFFYLEQLILKHRMHQHTLNIKEVHGGLDFYFGSKQEARKMVEFFNTVVPCRSKTSERLISHDVHTNTYNCKSAYSVEIVPICKTTTHCVSVRATWCACPPALARSLGNLGQVCVCARVTSAIHLIDPSTLQVAEVSGAVFWREPFGALSTPRSFTSFIVLDVETLRDQRRSAGAGATSSRHVLAEVWLQRWNEVGTGEQLHTRTHLGHLLKPGDRVLGLDLSCANFGDVEGASASSSPSVVLVRKDYERSRRARRRNWTLAELPREREGNHDVASDDESLPPALLSLLLHLLLHLLLRPESLLLLASVATLWVARQARPRRRCRGGGPAPLPAPPRVTWQYRSRGVAVFALQGRREHMEDRFTAAPRCGRRHRHALYGVFDGHGGEAAAEYVKRRLPDYLRRRLAEGDGADVEAALRDAVRRTEVELMETLGPAGNEAGTTCVLAVESAGRLYVANVGDSRAVLCDAQGSAVALSHDHKPHQLKERQRIKRAGGFISYNGSWRVQGVLAMSRSLGDFPLKRMGVVTAEPDVTAVDLRATRPRFLLMASDGLWDAFGSQEAVAFVGERLGEPHLGAKSVALQAFYRGCPDNITVVVVRYRTPRPGAAAGGG